MTALDRSGRRQKRRSPLVLSERRAFETADADVVRALVAFAETQEIVGRDLFAELVSVMASAEPLSLHSVKPAIVQTERGRIRTNALLALSLKRLVELGGRRDPARYLFAVAIGRCLPAYFVLRMLGSTNTTKALRLRAVSRELGIYTRNSVELGVPFLGALNRGARTAFARYRALVRLTCEAYQKLYDVLSHPRADAFYEYVQASKDLVFIVHFPLAIDLHYCFTEMFSRRPRRLDFEPFLLDLDRASSLIDVVRQTGGA